MNASKQKNEMISVMYCTRPFCLRNTRMIEPANAAEIASNRPCIAKYMEEAQAMPFLLASSAS